MKSARPAPDAAICKDAEPTVLCASNRPGPIVCTKCGEAKRPEDFHRCKSRSNGRQFQCKMCNKAYRAAHRDEILKRGAAYYAAHKDEIRKRTVAYYAAHRDKMQKYREVHKDERRKRNAAWCATHKNEMQKQSAAYYAAHKDEIRKRVAAWQTANPERRAILKARGAHKRRAREEQLPATLTSQEWRATLQAFEGCCAYCGKACGNKAHKDHVIPVMRGGAFELGNIVPACAACNLSKNSHDIQAWMKRRGHNYERFVAKLASLEATV